VTRSLKGRNGGEFIFTSLGENFAGWVRKDLPEGILTAFARDPEGLLNSSSARVIKEGPKTKVVQARLANGKGASADVIIKRFHYGFPRRLGFLIARSAAVRSLEGALLLQRHCFDTPVPVAAVELRSWKRLGTSYYITEEVAGGHSLGRLWQSEFSSMVGGRRARLARAIVREVARLLCRLHSAGIYHRDLKGSNILVQKWETGQRKFFFIDLDRVAEGRRVSLSKRINNLLQVRTGLWSLRERICFFMRYAELCSASREEGKALVRRLLTLHRNRGNVARRPAI
jgi:serine/threonine protein kinase